MSYTDAQVSFVSRVGSSCTVTRCKEGGSLVTIEDDGGHQIRVNGAELVDAIYSVIPDFLVMRAR